MQCTEVFYEIRFQYISKYAERTSHEIKKPLGLLFIRINSMRNQGLQIFRDVRKTCTDEPDTRLAKRKS